MSENTTETTETVEPDTSNEDQTAHEQLPEDHPLVKTLAAQKEQIKSLKERAQRLDDIEESQKSETEKANERLTAAETRAVEAESRLLRREVALDYQLSKDDAALLDTITDEDTMRALAQRLAAVDADKKHGNYVPREGNNPPAKPDERRAFADFLTGNAH